MSTQKACLPYIKRVTDRPLKILKNNDIKIIFSTPQTQIPDLRCPRTYVKY